MSLSYRSQSIDLQRLGFYIRETLVVKGLTNFIYAHEWNELTIATDFALIVMKMSS